MILLSEPVFLSGDLSNGAAAVLSTLPCDSFRSGGGNHFRLGTHEHCQLKPSHTRSQVFKKIQQLTQKRRIAALTIINGRCMCMHRRRIQGDGYLVSAADGFDNEKMKFGREISKSNDSINSKSDETSGWFLCYKMNDPDCSLKTRFRIKFKKWPTIIRGSKFLICYSGKIFNRCQIIKFITF